MLDKYDLLTVGDRREAVIQLEKTLVEINKVDTYRIIESGLVDRFHFRTDFIKETGFNFTGRQNLNLFNIDFL